MDATASFLGNLRTKIEALRVQYAPDKRLRIFAISARFDEEGTLLLEGETDQSEANAALIDFLQEQEVENYRDQIRLLPESLTGEYLTALPLSGYVPLYREPRHQAEMVNQALMGEKLQILKTAREAEWLLVQTPDNYLAWAPSENLMRLSLRTEKHWDRQDKLLITAWRAALRPTPGQPEKAFLELSMGMVVELLGYYSGCWQIQLPNGHMGFIPYDQACRLGERPLATAENILKTARRFFGLPYLWGGRSPLGIDCSGYIQLVFGFHGYPIPRDADQQSTHGETISHSVEDRAAFRPGDLLFMGNLETRKATHVAISLGGADFVHASGWVQVNSLDPQAPHFAPKRAQTFLCCQRLLAE